MATEITKRADKAPPNNRVELRATLPIKEAARVLGVGLNQAYAAAKNGELPVIRIGSRILVSRAGLEKMLNGG